MSQPVRSVTAFSGTTLIASGPLVRVALACKDALEAAPAAALSVFDDETAEPVEVDLRGSTEEIAGRYAQGAETGAPTVTVDGRRAPGRPKLGVVGREVTLLPRHWEWLNAQPGGASVALRKLVEQARRESADADAIRASQNAAFRFTSAMAGNEIGYEEAVRALYAADAERFEQCTGSWPADVRAYSLKLAAAALRRG